MAFTFADFSDLKQLLGDHPQWRIELRHLLISEDLEALPAIVRDLVEAGRATDRRLAELVEAGRATDRRLAELAEAQRETDLRLAELAEAQRETDLRLAELAEAQRQTDQRLADFQRHTDERFAELREAQHQTDLRLAEYQRHTDERFAELVRQIAQLVETQRRMEERLGGLEVRMGGLEVRMDGLEVRMDRVEVKLARVDGRTLEAEYRQKAPAYFGRWLKGAEVLGSNEIRDRVEAHLSEDELHDVLLLDMVVRGRASKQPSQPEVWLAVEVSSVVDREDVARAVRRTDLLRRAGLPAVPVVAGEHITEGGEAEVQRHHVALLQDGGAQFWSEAIAAWPLP